MLLPAKPPTAPAMAPATAISTATTHPCACSESDKQPDNTDRHETQKAK
jgi:hypothetical protein